MDARIVLSLRWLTLVTIMMVVAGFLAWPLFRRISAERTGFVEAGNDARRFAAALAAMNGKRSEGAALPADLGVASTAELLALLEAGGHLGPNEGPDELGIGKVWVVTNASIKDPPETALLVSRNVMDSFVTEPWQEDGIAVMTVEGRFAFLRKEEDREKLVLPDREPALLP